MTAMRKLMALALLLAGALPAAGCGKEVVAGKEIVVGGRVTGDATAEAGGSGSAGSGPRRLLGIVDSVVNVPTALDGTLDVEAKVELVSAGGEVVPLSSGPGAATVRIDGRDTAQVVRRKVPVVAYTTVRVTFTRVEANVVSGLVIGGVSITGRVSVDVAAGGVVVERPLSLPASAEEAEVLVDLDASAWLGAANPVTRLVSPGAFQAAVKVSLLE
jgi:hypothetical protein